MNILVSDLAAGPAPVRDRLRRATRLAHERLDERLALTTHALDLAGYKRLLEAMLGIYGPIEGMLARADWTNTGIDVFKRQKTAMLRADLRDLGHPECTLTDIPSCGTVPEWTSQAAALGCLYVVEGSTLGGQVIARHLGPQLGIGVNYGGRFYASYGRMIGPMWRQVVDAVNRVPEPDVPEAIDAALTTFGIFDEWLARTLPKTSPSKANE